jgi:hypothetical protein
VDGGLAGCICLKFEYGEADLRERNRQSNSESYVSTGKRVGHVFPSESGCLVKTGGLRRLTVGGAALSPGRHGYGQVMRSRLAKRSHGVFFEDPVHGCNLPSPHQSSGDQQSIKRIPMMLRELAQHINRLVEQRAEDKPRSLNDFGKPFRRCCRKRNPARIVLDLHFKDRDLADMPAHLVGVQQLPEPWRELSGIELRPKQHVGVEENFPHPP